MKLFICLSVAGMLTFPCAAQTDSIPSANKTDSIEASHPDSAQPKSTLTLGAVYCTNADYYGQTAQDKLPYVAAAATYRHKSGIYFTALAYRLLTDTGSRIASAENVSAGFEFKISKRLSADISYNHTFYPSLSPFLQAGNADNASLSFSYDAWIKPSLSADYAFGKTSDVFTTVGISKAITHGRQHHKKRCCQHHACILRGGRDTTFLPDLYHAKEVSGQPAGDYFPTDHRPAVSRQQQLHKNDYDL
jgi:hypothetical protein